MSIARYLKIATPIFLLLASYSTPVLAADWYDNDRSVPTNQNWPGSVAGPTGGNAAGPTKGNGYGDSQRTMRSPISLKNTVTSSPQKGGSNAPGNFALRQLGKNTLPPTRLNSFVRQGGDAVFGDEGVFLPPFNSFSKEHRIERALEQNPNLTTNHKIDAPEAWDFPN